jgi:hypothetical protein
MEEELEQPEPEKPVSPDIEDHPDDAHHATITAVKLVRRLDGRVSILVKLASRDVNSVAEFSIEVPTAFEIGLTEGRDFDPTTLPEDDENGRQQTIFRQSFANRKGDAWLQRLVFNMDSISRKDGKDPNTLDIIRKPATMEEYVHNLAEMLTGVNCIMLRRSGKVWNLVPDDDAPSYITDKRYKGYRLAWERD